MRPSGAGLQASVPAWDDVFSVDGSVDPAAAGGARAGHPDRPEKEFHVGPPEKEFHAGPLKKELHAGLREKAFHVSHAFSAHALVCEGVEGESRECRWTLPGAPVIFLIRSPILLNTDSANDRSLS